MESCLPSWGVVYPTEIIWNSSAQEIYSFSPMYLSGHLFIWVWSHWYLFYTLGYHPILLSKFCCSNFPTFGHWELFQLVPVSLWHRNVVVLFLLFSWALSYFLALQDVPGLFCMFISCSSPRSNHFSKEAWFLLLENAIINQDLSGRCAHCNWVVIESRPPQMKE